MYDLAVLVHVRVLDLDSARIGMGWPNPSTHLNY